MPTLQEMARKDAAFSGGHRMCAGCPVPIFTKMLTRVTDHELVVGSATGCLEVASSIFPYSAWKVPWIHTAFENTAATMSGVEAMVRVLRARGAIDRTIKCIAIGGDGGTYDIGLQSLSAAMERGHDLLYICYDNGAYMNTGIQRSSATPLGAATTTSPAGKVAAGKRQHRKNLTRIMVGHQIGYVAQASVHDPVDLSRKLKKGIEHDGPAFLNILCPCIPGWRIAPDMAVASARGAVETCYWPLFEVEDGVYKLNFTPREKYPLAPWLLSQGRFSHLKGPEARPIIDALQAHVDREWEWLCAQAGA